MATEHHVDDISPSAVDLVFVDAGGNSIDALEVSLKMDDGSTAKKTTDSSGKISLDGGAQGNVEISMPSGQSDSTGNSSEDSSSSGSDSSDSNGESESSDDSSDGGSDDNDGDDINNSGNDDSNDSDGN